MKTKTASMAPKFTKTASMARKFIKKAFTTAFKLIKSFIKPKTKRQPLDYPSFTHFIVQVDPKGSWHKTMKLIQKNVQGIISSHFEVDGKITVSGFIDPQLFLKGLEKSKANAQVLDWKYGECSSNLAGNPPKAESPKKNNENKSDGLFILPSYGAPNGYGYGYGYGNGYDNGFGHGNGYGYGNRYDNGFGNGNGFGNWNSCGSYGYERNPALCHLGCGENAEDCFGHHTGNRTNSIHNAERPTNSENTSSSLPKNHTGSR